MTKTNLVRSDKSLEDAKELRGCHVLFVFTIISHHLYKGSVRQCHFINQVIEPFLRLANKSPHFLPKKIIGIGTIVKFGKFLLEFVA
jgi:hypothetical protein